MLKLKKFKPTENRLLVKIAKEEEVTKGGIIIPDSAKEKPSHGTVIVTGPGLVNENGTVNKMYVKVNDNVLFSKYAGTELEIEDMHYVLIKETDVLAII